ncbi:MAG: OmpA family protein [Bacteroidales bacterium]|nr:OmpA family protein [Candidatus Cryptobacteroides choladohippi]MCQ2179574.1 OmpA family protein [Bacteroidales bacterium]
MKRFLTLALCGLVIFTSCGNMSNLGKGALIGTGAGAALGAGVGAIFGGQKGAAIGAAIGTAVGAGTGAVIGDVMDRKAKELEEALDASVETVTDANGLEAIKVTFDNGILFDTNKSNLSASAKSELKTFAQQMSDLPDTQITVYGHTDNTGTAAVNEKISKQRADAVTAQLMANGIDKGRIVSEGKSFNEPVATNDTAEGRAQNRRVEVYISANADMVKAAEEGKLK